MSKPYLKAFPDARLIDLVRYCRAVLHEDGLITDEEYAELVKVGSESARRLETYDELRNKIDLMEKLIKNVQPATNGIGIQCYQTDGKNWFDLRQEILKN